MNFQNITHGHNYTQMSKNFAPTSEKLNQIKSKGDFSNVRSDYILREFLIILQNIKHLEL